MANEDFDAEWFKDRYKALGYSQRAFARFLGMDESIFNKMINGKRDMSSEEAANLAEVFGVGVEEVLQKAGVRTPKPPSTVRLVALLDDNFDLSPRNPPARVPMPGRENGTAVAARCEDPSAMFLGYTVYYEPFKGISPDAIGRTSVVRFADGSEHIRIIRHGIDRKSFSLFDVAGRPAEDARVIAATPVLLTKP